MNRPSPVQANPKLWYSNSLDFEQLWKDYPPAPNYFDHIHTISAGELRLLQERRFLKQMERGWQIPFYRQHWSKHGLEPGDVRSIEDLEKVPPYTVHDLRDSIERAPPWGDYFGLDPARDEPMPLVLQTSGGTTGLPRAMIYSPRDREVMNILNGRRFCMQGVRPFDLIQVTLGLGLANGGFSAREGIWKYTGAIPLMTGSGAQTPTRRQIELMHAWKTRFLLGFPAYLRHMAFVARDEMSLDPASLGLKGLLVHLGRDRRETLEELWGAPVYDCYGSSECGAIGAECSYQQGMHVFEDGFIFEVNDPETHERIPDGKKGSVFLTALFRQLAPIIRFNTYDLSAIVPGTCPCGGTHRRLERIFGRVDGMVKLRGVNVFPEAIGTIVGQDARCNGEFVCITETVSAEGRDEMTVLVESVRKEADAGAIQADLETELKQAIGLKLTVRLVRPGELDETTGLTRTSKVKRLVDRRRPV